MGKLPNSFFTSIDFTDHPLKLMSVKKRKSYVSTIRFLSVNVFKNECTDLNFKLYTNNLRCDPVTLDESSQKEIKKFVNSLHWPWNKKYGLWLYLDLMLINVPDNSKIQKFQNEIVTCFSLFLNKKKIKKINKFYGDIDSVISKSLVSKSKFQNCYVSLYNQVKMNKSYFNSKIKNIIFTANMSSGKSSVINALVGKRVARTAQEVCTGNVCNIYPKSFEDGRMHVAYYPPIIDYVKKYGETLKYNFDLDDIDSKNVDWSSKSVISTYYNICGTKEIICFIDTPGVNSSMNPVHKQITVNALQTLQYDSIVYILNANSLGTEEEIAHLKWVFNNLQGKSIVFVLNKLDTFKSQEDSISESIENVRNDLVKIGFINPVICPVSAYFAFLLKKKMNGVILDEDETDELEMYTRKFSKPQYDLSKYYSSCGVESSDSLEVTMLKKCGFYGLERLLGGKI